MVRRPSSISTFAFLLCVVQLSASSATAALLPVRTGDGTVTFEQPIQTTFAICQNDWVHLLTQVGYRARGGARAVPRIGWVVPLPEGAPHDTVADAEPLSMAWNWATYLATVGDPTAQAGIVSSTCTPARCSVEILPGRPELLAWLAENGFGPPPQDIVTLYHDMGWVFAAVKAEPATDGGSLPATGMLRPLLASYRNRDLVLPSLLARENGSYHHVLFIASDLPVNPGDARAHGFVPMIPADVAERFDRVAWQAAAPESSRAFIRDLFGTPELAEVPPAPQDTFRRRDRALEWEGAWLAEMVAGLRREVINLPASFSGRRREEFAPVPPVIEDHYGRLLRAAGSEPMDLFLSAFCAPAMNLPDSRSDLRYWTADPRIRLELSPNPRPALQTPSLLAIDNGDYRPPRRAFLPLSEELALLCRDFQNAREPREIDRQAGRILREARAYQQVAFLRQLERARGDTLTSDLGDDLNWPSRGGAITNPRNMSAFERAFRRISRQLTALRGEVIIRNRNRGDDPEPLMLIYRLHVAPDGTVDDAQVSGNLPSRLHAVAECMVERGVLLPPADSAETYDFLVVIR